MTQVKRSLLPSVLIVPVAVLVLAISAQADTVSYNLAGTLSCWQCNAGDLTGFDGAEFQLTAQLDSGTPPISSGTYPPFSYANYNAFTSLTISGSGVPGSNGIYSSTEGELFIQDMPSLVLYIEVPAPFGFFNQVPFQFYFTNTWSGTSPSSPVLDDSGIWLMIASVTYGFVGPADTYTIELTEAAISAVPEASSISLLGIGLVGLIGYGWKRKG
jgi:hypothetical protein